MPNPLIIVFLKSPRPGYVKTRLAKEIGDIGAATAYRQLCDTLFSKLHSVRRVQLRFTPDEAKPEILHWLNDHWEAKPQGEGDLGERMDRAFEEADGPAIIIGSDCPYLEIADLEKATEALEKHDMVIGPANDGGYWLIGLNSPCPTLFRDINWGTHTVLGETLAQAEIHDLSVHLVRELQDIDRATEWKDFCKRS